jgi:predicted phage terminase large subunit-like protein
MNEGGGLSPALLFKVASRPGEALKQLKKIKAEESLLAFVRLMWPVIEPEQPFVEGRLIGVVCEHLEAVTDGRIKKLLINIPFGTAKSLLVNVFWPAFEWGPRNRPSTRYITASYAESLSIRDNRRCRQLINSPIYQEFWGDRFKLTSDQNEKRRYENDKTGWRYATSVGGPVTGERADRIIIDDPHNVRQAESDVVREEALLWFAEAVSSRVNNPEDVIRGEKKALASTFVVIMQRLHSSDVAGMILKSMPGWTHLCLPMEYEKDHPFPCKADWRTEDGELLFPERYSRKYLEEDLKPTLAARGGSFACAGQLQQRPIPREGGLFQKHWFKFLDLVPSQIRSRVRGWDLAASKDKRAARTAGVRMSRTSDGKIVIEDSTAGHWTAGEVEDRIAGIAEQDRCAIFLPQDPGQAGLAQKGALTRRLVGHDVHFSPETGSKEDRARPLAAQAEAGNVYLVRGPWNDDYLKELTEFPAGDRADQVDASSRAFLWLVQGRQKTPPSSGGWIIE